MSRWNRAIFFVTLAVLALGCAAAVAQEAFDSTPSSAWPTEFHDDAHLYDVTFLDAHHGWAVGDRGTIWRTDDGGSHWSLQSSPVAGRLEAIQFLDAERGWVVGGFSLPYTHRSQGIVLTTSDGGQHWKQLPSAMVPWLKGIAFLSDRRGYAWGSSSPLYPSGLLETRDAGYHWNAVSGVGATWVDGQLSDRAAGILLNRQGAIGRLRDNQLAMLSATIDPDRRAVALMQTASGRWVACGNQGLVRVSHDQGQTWQTPRLDSSAHDVLEFDWQAIHTRGKQVWIVGDPGTVVLHSDNEGETFSAQPTEQTLPLYRCWFLDEQQGWAVGALGVILTTRDGGQTWVTQRGHDRRLAAMVVVGSIASIPWEVVTQASSLDGARVTLECLSAPHGTDAPSGETPLGTRLHEGLVWAGGASAHLIESLRTPDVRWELPVAQVTSYWQQPPPDDAQAPLTEYLTRQMRIWRPDRIIVRVPSTSTQGLDQFAWETVQAATNRAASAQRYPGQLQGARLRPWRVSQWTLVRTPQGSAASAADERINGNHAILARGETVGAIATQAVARLATQPSREPPTYLVQSIDARLSPAQGSDSFGDDLTSRNVDQRLVGETTHRLTSHSGLEVRQPSERIQTYRQLEALLRGELGDNPVTNAQVLHLISELPTTARGELLFQAGSRDLERGRIDHTFACWDPFRDELADHPLAEATWLRLLWYRASAEGNLHWHSHEIQLAPRTSLAKSVIARSAAESPSDNPLVTTIVGVAAVRDSAANRAPANGAPSDDETSVQPATALQPLPLEQQTVRPLRQETDAAVHPALAIYRTIQTRGPHLLLDTRVGFAWAAFQARTGQTEAAARFWKSQLHGGVPPAYRNWASTEWHQLRRTAQPRSPSSADAESFVASRPLWRCRLAAQPPQLDGRLDESLWHDAVSQLLGDHRNADNRGVPAATRVWMAYDREFLYMAASCEITDVRDEEDGTATDDQGGRIKRRRDELLTRDRLEWFVDIDRDGVTWWQWAVDDQGAARESLLDDASWNPRWYVATSSDGPMWTMEAAMPLTSLAAERPTPGTIWALGLQRVVPGIGAATWQQAFPVDQAPQEFGILAFE